jgi:hypothetical protein
VAEIRHLAGGARRYNDHCGMPRRCPSAPILRRSENLRRHCADLDFPQMVDYFTLVCAAPFAVPIRERRNGALAQTRWSGAGAAIGRAESHHGSELVVISKRQQTHGRWHQTSAAPCGQRRD